MRPHSADLRRRIVTLYERGEGSIRQLAKRFQVSPDSVRCLIKQYRASGSISPKPYTGGPQPMLQATHHEVLRELIETDNDATLAQLAQRLAIRTGTHVSSSTISRTLSKLGITRKKKSQGQRSLPSPETTAAL
ncbi:MAG: transposase [Nodosilinea sp.]